jgi:hypothetical protein
MVASMTRLDGVLFLAAALAFTGLVVAALAGVW